MQRQVRLMLCEPFLQSRARGTVEPSDFTITWVSITSRSLATTSSTTPIWVLASEIASVVLPPAVNLGQNVTGH